MTDSNFGNRALCLRSPKSVSSNKVAIARALEEEMGNRQGQRTDLEPRNNCYEVEPGKRSDEIAAEKAGFGSHMTYRRAKRVVDKGVPELAEAMDAGGRRGRGLD